MVIGGTDAFWGMHDWLLTHRELDDESLTAAAESIGLPGGMLLQTMGSSEVLNGILDDAQSAQRTRDVTRSLLFRGSLPTVYVNGRVTPRWKLRQGIVLPTILDAAAGAAGQ